MCISRREKRDWSGQPSRTLLSSQVISRTAKSQHSSTVSTQSHIDWAPCQNTRATTLSQISWFYHHNTYHKGSQSQTTEQEQQQNLTLQINLADSRKFVQIPFTYAICSSNTLILELQTESNRSFMSLLQVQTRTSTKLHALEKSLSSKLPSYCTALEVHPGIALRTNSQFRIP